MKNRLVVDVGNAGVPVSSAWRIENEAFVSIVKDRRQC